MSKRSLRANKYSEEQLLLDYCLSKKRVFLDEFLREKNVRISGNRDTIREQINQYLLDQILFIEDLAEFLDRVEGWGNQHVFCYQVPAATYLDWKSDSIARKILQKEKVFALLNAKRPVLMPDGAELASIELTKERLKLIWVEGKTWYQRKEELDDYSKEGFVFKAYRLHSERRVTWFELDLVSGNAYLAIPNIAKANADISSQHLRAKKDVDHYSVLERQFLEFLNRFLTVASFKKLRFSKALRQLEQSTEVRSRQTGMETAQGGKISFTSPDEQTDINADQDIKLIRPKLPATIKSVQGGFYWESGYNGLDRQLYAKLDAHSSSIAFREQCSELEVRSVLQRVRQLC